MSTFLLFLYVHKISEEQITPIEPYFHLAIHFLLYFWWENTKPLKCVLMISYLGSFKNSKKHYIFLVIFTEISIFNKNTVFFAFSLYYCIFFVLSRVTTNRNTFYNSGKIGQVTNRPNNNVK